MRLNRSALVFGVVFVLVGGAYLLEELGVWVVRTGYLLPALLVVAGLALTVTALVEDRS